MISAASAYQADGSLVIARENAAPVEPGGINGGSSGLEMWRFACARYLVSEGMAPGALDC
jgi:hypothetical protein